MTTSEQQRDVGAERPPRPLGGRVYGSVPHLPGSNTGPADHTIHHGQAAICLLQARDRHDLVVVLEKLNGSMVAVARIGGEIVPLIRAGYRADDSHYEQHHLFAAWVYYHQERFRALLRPGERVCGEWLAQAHGTRYRLTEREPFAPFDLVSRGQRLPWFEAAHRFRKVDLIPPALIHAGQPLSLREAASRLGTRGYHDALDPAEGMVYRVERTDTGQVDFLAKWVRPGFPAGRYLPEISGQPPVWNWRPEWSEG